MKSGNETLIFKTTRPTNAEKKVLTTTLQIRHFFLQKLNTGIYGINSWLNSPHKKGSGNLTKMIKDKLHCKTHTDKFLNHSPPLQDSLGRNRVDEVMLNIVQHAP